MDFVDRLNTTSFLGKEFLTWLWFKSDVQEGLVGIPDGGPAAEIWFCDSIQLSGSGEGAERVTMRAEDPSLSPECRVALRHGKKVEKGKVRIVRGQREWTLSITGESLAVSSVKIPALLTREADEKLIERLSLLDQLDSMITALFGGFIELRLSAEEWPAERTAMQAWVQGDGPDRLSRPATAIVEVDESVEAEAVLLAAPEEAVVAEAVVTEAEVASEEGVADEPAADEPPAEEPTAAA
ncbi:MAG: hypothetical protein ACI9WU_003668 [Myxococcota bacterium]|jgi:hypothetical protein